MHSQKNVEIEWDFGCYLPLGQQEQQPRLASPRLIAADACRHDVAAPSPAL